MEHMTTTDIQPAGVQMTGLVKSYGSVRAVQGIDLTIAPGETLALLGPNGAGWEESSTSSSRPPHWRRVSPR